MTAHVGYNFGSFWQPDEFVDYSIGIARSFGKFDLALKYIDGSDLAIADGTPDDVFSSESKLFFSVATTLPW